MKDVRKIPAMVFDGFELQGFATGAEPWTYGTIVKEPLAVVSMQYVSMW